MSRCFEHSNDPRHKCYVRTGENRQADRMRILLSHGLDDLLWRLVEALVDDVHASVSH
jgi:hypothetical protein